MAVYNLQFDGSSSGDRIPTASYGHVLYRDGKEIDRGYGLLGRAKNLTSMVAEYYGLSAGIDSFVRHWNKPCSVLNIYGDCKPLLAAVRQGGKLKSSDILMLRLKIDQIRSYGIKVNIHWLPRKSNKIAHDLAHFFQESNNQGS